MIRAATLADLDHLIPLFAAYHQFYHVESSDAQRRDFLSQRLQRNESFIWMAFDEQRAIGFVQMYPTFASLSMQRSFVLYDLFVDQHTRQKGIGEQLLNVAEQFAREQGACEISLQTAHSNLPAQRLYERLGYQRENAFYTYYKSLKP